MAFLGVSRRLFFAHTVHCKIRSRSLCGLADLFVGKFSVLKTSKICLRAPSRPRRAPALFGVVFMHLQKNGYSRPVLGPKAPHNGTKRMRFHAPAVCTRNFKNWG